MLNKYEPPPPTYSPREALHAVCPLCKHEVLVCEAGDKKKWTENQNWSAEHGEYVCIGCAMGVILYADLEADVKFAMEMAEVSPFEP